MYVTLYCNSPTVVTIKIRFSNCFTSQRLLKQVPLECSKFRAGVLALSFHKYIINTVYIYSQSTISKHIVLGKCRKQIGEILLYHVTTAVVFCAQLK